MKPWQQPRRLVYAVGPVLLGAVLAACGSEYAATALANSTWGTQAAEFSETALFETDIAIGPNGCVMGATEDRNLQPIAWPAGYSARTDMNGVLELLDEHGDVVARSGMTLSLGGGWHAAGENSSAPLDRCLTWGVQTFYVQAHLQPLD